jgi:hypothetical protein
MLMVKGLEDLINLSLEEHIEFSNNVSEEEWTELKNEFDTKRESIGLDIIIKGLKIFITHKPKDNIEAKKILKRVSKTRNLVINNINKEREEYKEIIALCDEIEGQYQI